MRFAKCTSLMLLSATLWAQTAQPASPTPAKKTAPTSTAKKRATNKVAAKQPVVTAADVQELRDALEAQRHQMAAQQLEIQQLRDELASNANNTKLQPVASVQLAAAAVPAVDPAAFAALQSAVSDLKAGQVVVAQNMQEQQKRIGELESPMAIHFRGVTITPGGFLEAGYVFRGRNENASINSASGDFNIPLSGTPNAMLSESRFDARQSRISLLAEGKIAGVKATGYYEADFLGAAPTANENQSNSFNLRQRQIWGSAQFHNGLSFTGGQQFSLFTLNRKAMDNRTEFLPMVINAQYVIGYDWARQPSFRVVKNFTNKTWVGFAVENSSMVNPNTVNTASATLTSGTIIPSASSNPPLFGFANDTNATSPNGNFTLSNTTGANGVSTNVAPDLIAKVAFEPGWGHYELKAMGRFFRDRFAGQTNSAVGGGIGAGVVLPVVISKIDFVGEATVGNGIGRYGSGGGVDVTLRPNTAAIAPIRSYHVLAGPELHLGKNLDVYLYGGEEYYARNVALLSPVAAVGYGSSLFDNRACSFEQTTSTGATGSCANQTRYAFEVAPGFWYRFYKGSAGTVAMGAQYSYSERRLWGGVGGATKGVENQFYTSFRYYLP